jgi:ABC-type sugar transport system substrate-binding protein
MKKARTVGSILIVICMLAALMLTACTQSETPTASASETSAESVSAESATSQETEEASAESASDEKAGSEDATVAELVAEASTLKDMEAFAFFESLADKGLTDSQIIQFFIDLPLSDANQQIHDMYLEEGFDAYAEAYPAGEFYDGFEWTPGMGTEITGGFTGNSLKLPFSDDYVPLEEGPIGDANKTYKVGVVSSGLNNAWIGNFQDSIDYEAARHENIELLYMDYNFDMNAFSTQFDTCIAQGVDIIITWPQVEASSGPAAQRAEEAGIPVVSADRVTSYADVTARVTGNFPANGAQCGMYMVWKLAQDANNEEVAGDIVMLRKPAGSTADTIRSGYFLKVLSYFPGINILQSYHDPDNREEAYVNAQNAFQAHENIDGIFCGDYNKAAVAYQAATEANRLNSREGGKEIIFVTCDDSKELYQLMQQEDGVQMNAPYTPLIGDIAMRVAIKILEGEDIAQDIATPNIPMTTREGSVIFGLQTQLPEDWYEYTFGPEYEG